jgi:ATP-binding cassette subfamily B (MDR/TAP) protein 1
MMEGCVAAYRIFEMIERVPPIDIDDHSQRTLEKVDGNLELRNVDFAYPSRIHAQIFRNFNLQIPAGRTVALVGSSGSGKSTVVALLERFYDPSAGQVLIDGVDIKNLQLKWLRNQIGLVSQEPALFATSIVANILYGKDHSSMEEVIEAAKSANAHNFISQLPDGYETQVVHTYAQLQFPKVSFFLKCTSTMVQQLPLIWQ